MTTKLSVVVTGANGLLGRSLVEICERSGFEVYRIVHSVTSNSQRDNSTIHLDLKQSWRNELLPSKADVVIHLAQSNYYRNFPEHADDLFGVNIAATSQLLSYAKSVGATQFIYASTGGVYSPGPSTLHENSPIHDTGRLGAYFGSKICGEILVRNYTPYLTATILRPFFVYGKGQKRNVHLPRIFDNIRNGHAIQIQGDNGISMNPIHVKDAALAVLAAIERPLSSVVNIAGPEVLTIRQIAEGFASFLNVKPFFEQAPGHPESLVADISLMSSRLHEPTIRLFESIFDVAP